MDDPQCPALGLLLHAASQSPQWVERLMGLRNRIVAVVGLKNLGVLRGVDSSKPLADYRPGQRVGIFTLISVSDDEVVLGDQDKHLDVVVSVLRLPLDGQGQREAAFTTAVYVHGWLGRLYMLPVAPMHRRIVPAVLRGALGASADIPQQ